MKPAITAKILVALTISLLLFPETSNAAADYATFESFYRESSGTIWILAGATIAAIIAGAIIIYTGGAASPIVVSMGTWVGGLMGYSGVAATNAGLALLGGGSVATGGFGMAGGAALLTAAFSFGTGVVFDYSAEKAVEAYDYSRFVEGSKNMTTLPLPKNTFGPDSYKDALDILKDVNQEEALSTNQNQAIIRKAIKTVEAASKSVLTQEERVRERSLLALLYFISNDYIAAKKYADASYRLALNTNATATLPAFIYATSSLYDEKTNFKKANVYFKYAIENEPDNPLSPLMFAIYLDRVMYRFNDGHLPYSSLDNVYSISTQLQYDERKAVIQMGLLTRYFTSIKLEQQKIISLTKTSNSTIKDSPKTLETVRNALKEYKNLLTYSKKSIDGQSVNLRYQLQRDPSISDRAKGGGIQDWETQWNSKIGVMSTLWSSYSSGVAGLESLVKELVIYQAELERRRMAE